MVAVPGATPVTTPVVKSTVAVPVALLTQVPPADASASVVVRPTHTVVVPVISAGSGLTVTTSVLKQPVVGNV